MKIYMLFLMLMLFSCTETKLNLYEEEIKTYRLDYVNGFLEEDRSPLNKNDLKDLNFYIADSSYRVIAEYKLTEDALPFDLKTSSGKTKIYRKFAKLDFSLEGESFQLFVYESMKLKDMDEYKNYLFLPFTDITNGETSYGGGRYLDLDRQDFVEGKTEFDFNKSYNPWCHYSDGYNCPVPPSENDLNISIHAGERKFSGTYKSKDK